MTQTEIDFDAPHFDGATLSSDDHARLGKQLARVMEVIRDGVARTPEQLEAATGYRWASISARLRDLRKPCFGARQVEREAIGGRQFTYRFVK